jgi:hypothetical protein
VGGPALFGPAAGAPPAGGGGSEAAGPAGGGAAPGPAGASGPEAGAGGFAPRGGSGFGGPGAFGGEGSLTSVLSYVRAHGGGTIAVSSQSSAASAIIRNGADVAGIGGFSGRESYVSVSWLAAEIRAGRIRWVVGSEQSGPALGGGFAGRLPGDDRTGARTALAAVARACRAAALPSSSAGSTTAGASLYDCRGRAAALTSGESREAGA